MASKKELPNSLWAKWILEAADKAADKNPQASKTYSRASRSIKNYSVKLNHPNDALALNGVGPKVVKIITEKLKQWCTQQNAEFPHQVVFFLFSIKPLGEENKSQKKSASVKIGKSIATKKRTIEAQPSGSDFKKVKRWKPNRRDAAWGILVAMRSLYGIESASRYICKDTIIKCAEKYCDYSYSAPHGNSTNRTQWHSGKLLRHRLISLHEAQRPRKYFLTDTGFKLSTSLATEESIPNLESASQDFMQRVQADAPSPFKAALDDRFNTETNQPTVQPSPCGNLVPSIVDNVQPKVWKAGSYTIELILDNREVSSATDRDGLFKHCRSTLQKSQGGQCKAHQRALAVGDALWIAVHKETGKEVVLDSIVERKRIDDLCSSITDSRFHEQKARLKNSGLKDCIYLIESSQSRANSEKFEQQKIRTSKAELMVLNNCHLHITNHWKQSAEYLAMRTGVLQEIHQNMDLALIPDDYIERSTYLPLLSALRKRHPNEYWVVSYEVFDSLNDKSANLTVKDIWARMIYRINGMSVEKVSEFVTRWPTPRLFWDEFHNQENYKNATSSTAKKNLAEWLEEQLTCDGENRRKQLGASLSKKISDLYSHRNYHHPNH
ncbi:ERCC4 domain-containing protein [Phakopsora pachyrhizi]|uniref:Crossover junction endonuclease MUS81 n=1 Tax=Phakopsora pachyrhizi TaxID=170000 RepID=A0AAV0AT02_PHAPC|nr:ERCC4 domain-containing protein [Phakopsora pachyrhizi]CAH7671055.1 ERCC4 domain-domain-containing protein [Phakopsora pachyrhizi]